MALQYVLDQRPDHLHMTFRGTYEASLIPEFLELITHLMVKNRPEKMLCDCREVTGDLSMVDRFNLGVGFAEKFKARQSRESLPDCRIAMVGNPPLIKPDGFGVQVARNRGIDVMGTPSLEEAREWLGLGPEDPTTAPG